MSVEAVPKFTPAVVCALPPAQLNNVNIGAVGELAAAIAADNEKGATTWNSSVKWAGGFKSEASVRTFPSTLIDEPLALGGTDTSMNPVELLLSALGSCLVVGYSANATVQGIELEELRVDVSGALHLASFLGVTPGHAGFSGIKAKVHLVATGASAAQIAELHRVVQASSPVGHTLAEAIPIDISPEQP